MKNHHFKVATLLLNSENMLVLMMNQSDRPEKSKLSFPSEEEQTKMNEWLSASRLFHIRKQDEQPFDEMCILIHGPFQDGAQYAARLREGLMIDVDKVIINGVYASIPQPTARPTLERDFPLVTIDVLPPQAKNLAAIWVEDLMYGQKEENEACHLLASDIVNYARINADKIHNTKIEDLTELLKEAFDCIHPHANADINKRSQSVRDRIFAVVGKTKTT